jgi:iron-sulfur cluster repair protein YtfE (RIC family)
MSDKSPTGPNPTDPYALDGRAGLPDHLRVLADLYPRADWQDHPNFNELTAFWLERHGMFRQLNATLIEGTQRHLDGDNPRFGPELQRYTGFYLNQLMGHHQIEDHHYFPQFIPLDKRLERGFEILDRDHHALDAHIHNLAETTNNVLRHLAEGQDNIKASKDLLEAQTGFARFLHRHLEDEEDLIVPVILEYGPEMQG